MGRLEAVWAGLGGGLRGKLEVGSGTVIALEDLARSVNLLNRRFGSESSTQHPAEMQEVFKNAIVGAHSLGTLIWRNVFFARCEHFVASDKQVVAIALQTAALNKLC